MTKDDVVSLYLSKNRTARNMVDRLIRWDSDKTLKENAVMQGMSEDIARQFKMKFNLMCVSRVSRLTGKRHIKCYAYAVLKDAGWTFDEIGAAFEVSRQAVHMGIMRVGDRRKRKNA